MAEEVDFYRELYKLLLYGLARADYLLTGQVEAFFRTAIVEAGKELGKIFIKKLQAGNDMDQIIQSIIDFFNEKKVAFEELKVIERKDEEVTIGIKGCPFGALCKRFAEEGLKDPRGLVPCIGGLQIAGILEMVLGEPIDWEYVNFSPPNCVVKLKRL